MSLPMVLAHATISHQRCLFSKALGSVIFNNEVSPLVMWAFVIPDGIGWLIPAQPSLPHAYLPLS